MPGGWPSHPELSNPASHGLNYPASHGTTVTTAAGANTKGAWTQLVASTTGGAGFIVVQAAAPGLSAMTQASIDLGIGPVGGEVVVAANLLVQGPASSAYLPAVSYFQIPIEIRATSRISARAQCNVATATPVYVSVQAFDQGFPGNPQLVDTYGFNAATTFGTAVNGGGTINTKGSWVALSAATTYDLTGFVLAFDMQGDVTSGQGNVQYLLDIGVGGVGSEQIVVPDVSLFSLRNALPGGVTWNPADQSGVSFSNSNRTASANTTAQAGVRATVGRSTGKYYFEVTTSASGGGSSGVSGTQTVGTPVVMTGPTAATVTEGGTVAITGVSATDTNWPWGGGGYIAINVSTAGGGTVTMSIAGSQPGSTLTGTGTTFCQAFVGDADRTAVLGSIVYTASSTPGSATVGIEIWDQPGNHTNISIAVTITATAGLSFAYSLGLATASWNETDTNGPGSDTTSLAIDIGTTIWFNNVSTTSAHPAIAGGDTVGLALDLDATKLYIRVNGGAFTGDPVAGTGGYSFAGIDAGPYFPLFSAVTHVGDAATINGGSSAFRDTAPAGYTAWGSGAVTGAAYNTMAPPCSQYYAVPIKAGSRIAARVQCSNNDAAARVIGVTLYGVRA